MPNSCLFSTRLPRGHTENQILCGETKTNKLLGPCPRYHKSMRAQCAVSCIIEHQWRLHVYIFRFPWIFAACFAAEIVNLPSTKDLTALFWQKQVAPSSTEKNLSTTPYLAQVRSTTPHSQRYGTLTSLRHHHNLSQPTKTLNLIHQQPSILCPHHGHDPPTMRPTREGR